MHAYEDAFVFQLRNDKLTFSTWHFRNRSRFAIIGVRPSMRLKRTHEYAMALELTHSPAPVVLADDIGCYQTPASTRVLSSSHSTAQRGAGRGRSKRPDGSHICRLPRLVEELCQIASRLAVILHSIPASHHA